MTAPLEDRLRAHFAERTEREPLPGPDPDDALARTLDVATRRRRRATSSNGRRNHLFLAVAAAAVLALGTVAFVVTRDDSDNVRTIDDPRQSTTTTTDTTTPEPSEPAGDATSTTSSSTTSTSAPPATSGMVTFIVGVDGVLGWYDGSTWVQAEADSQIPVEGGLEYQVLRVGSAPQVEVGGPPGDVECVEGGGNPVVDVGIEYPDDMSVERPPIAVTGVDEPLIRPVQVLDPNNGDYQAAASQVLTDLGIDDPSPPVVQAVRSDLDGDGTDEVLLVAERRAVSEPYLQGSVGDYSVVMLRRVVDGQVQTTVVRQWITRAEHVPYVESFRVSAVGDLNVDDHMEVVVDSHYYEGHSASVYEMQGTTLTSVLTAGCGV